MKQHKKNLSNKIMEIGILWNGNNVGNVTDKQADLKKKSVLLKLEK